jgi:hypothetical protein
MAINLNFLLGSIDRNFDHILYKFILDLNLGIIFGNRFHLEHCPEYMSGVNFWFLNLQPFGKLFGQLWSFNHEFWPLWKIVEENIL